MAKKQMERMSGLPITGVGMEMRREMAQSIEGQTIVDLLGSERYVELRSKAANALSSLFMNQDAGQVVMDKYGSEITRGLETLLLSKNYWEQGDAVCLLGWMVKIERLDQDKLFVYIPLVVDNMQHYGPGKTKVEANEKFENYRIYGLVCLLNMVQRDARKVLEYTPHFRKVWQFFAVLFNACKAPSRVFTHEHQFELFALIAAIMLPLVKISPELNQLALELNMPSIIAPVQERLKKLEGLSQLLEILRSSCI